MFEPGLLAERGLSAGLVFVNTDHGFSLGHEPGTSDARAGLVVARERGDALDHLLWQRLGRPPAFRYRYDPLAAHAVPSLVPYRPAALSWIEAEGLYPPASVSGGLAHPASRAEPCVSHQRVLRLRPTSEQPLRVTLRLPPLSGLARQPSTLALAWIGEQPPRVRWRSPRLESPWFRGPPAGGPCGTIELPALPSEALETSSELEVEAEGDLGLDYLTLVPERKSVDN
jgi:hypothetical protein